VLVAVHLHDGGPPVHARPAPQRTPPAHPPQRVATSPHRTNPRALAAPWVRTMAATGSAGTAQCWPAAHASARTIGAHTARPDTTSSAMRPAPAGYRRSPAARRSSRVSAAHTPSVISAAPPTWGTAARLTNPAATTGGPDAVSTTAARPSVRGPGPWRSARSARTRAAAPAKV